MYPWEHLHDDSTDDDDFDDFDSVDVNPNTGVAQAEGVDDGNTTSNDRNSRSMNVRLSQHHRNERVPSILSLYRIDLDFNVAAEVEDQLSEWQELQLNYCSGEYMHQVVKASFQPTSTIQKLSIKGGALDEAVLEELRHGLKKQQEQRQQHQQQKQQSTMPSLLTELILTIEMSTDVTRMLWQRGINAVSRRSNKLLLPSAPTTVNPLPMALQKLNMSQCEFGNDTIAVLAEHLAENCHLTSLNLDHCRLDDGEAAQVIQALEGHPSLTDLSIRLNYCETKSGDALAHLLANNQTKLQRLNIAQQDPGLLDMEVLSNALATNTTLLHLDARENYVRTSHIAALARALTSNRTLQELNLENCDVRTAGWMSILANLPNMQGLLYLWLQQNPINETAEGAAATNLGLMQALEKNATIHIIDLPHYQAKEPEGRQRRESREEEQLETNQEWMPYLYLNRGGRKLLEPNSISLAMWPLLLARANRLIPLPPTRFPNDGGETDDFHDNNATSSVRSGSDDGVSQTDLHEKGDNVDNKNTIGTKFGSCDILYMLLHGPALLER
jgi:hypothetical protein